MPPADAEARQVAVWYHQRSKHQVGRFAPSLGYMDWATQPDPFRRYIGAPLVSLLLPDADHTPPYERLYEPGGVSARSLDLTSLSELFYYALAISAWKVSGPSRWALRVNPSSGNLHPTEGYLIAGPVDGLSDEPGVWHYAPKEHGLEQRGRLDESTWSRLTRSLGEASCFVALSSVHWREAWKYGERAWRYCQHDAGHALGALRLAAAMLGWSLQLLPAVSDEQLGRLIGVDRNDEFPAHESETPDMLTVITPHDASVNIDSLQRDVAAAVESAETSWCGKANPLSADHHPWPAIDLVSKACRKPPDWQAPECVRTNVSGTTSLSDEPCGETAGQIVRRRRSAVDMDGCTGLDRGRFYRMLGRTVPSLTAAPWDCLRTTPMVHLGLFVHRVEGLAPGLWVLVRDEAQVDRLKQAMGADFAWQRPPDCPAELPLFMLKEGDAQRLAAQVSCSQAIAGASAFSLGMLADLERMLDEHGPPGYRHLYWETGLIGHVLYLDAEAAGLRGTGIGCFFDDAMHDALGIKDLKFQSLYHFTVGGPVEDTRLRTWPAYPAPDEAPAQR